MGLLNKMLTDIVSKDEKSFGTFKPATMMRTGFQILDYLNGSTSIVGKEKKLKFDTGIDSGKSIIIIGKPGSGKSTLGIQIATDIMKQYEESTLYIYDFENATTVSRLKAVSGMDDKWVEERIHVFNNGIYTESVLKMAKEIYRLKVDNYDKLKIKNPRYVKDNGEEEYMLPPTFIMIDSVAMMRTEIDSNDEEDTLSSNTAGARNAIRNKDLLVQLIQPCAEANIVLIMINHINSKPSMNGMPQVGDTKFLKNDETVSGGKAVQYAANLWIQVDAGKKLEITDPYGVKGFIATLKIVKSRNSAGGNELPVIFSQASGFDEDLSSLEFLKSVDQISGAGKGLYLPGVPGVKFSNSNLKEKLSANPEFKKAFEALVESELQKTVIPSSNISIDSREAPLVVGKASSKDDASDSAEAETDVEADKI